jgi:hypothetical protein
MSGSATETLFTAASSSAIADVYVHDPQLKE